MSADLNNAEQTARLALACLDLTSLNDGDDDRQHRAALRQGADTVRQRGRGVRLAALRGAGARPAAGRHPRGGGGRLPRR
jgi:hypothetical protein